MAATPAAEAALPELAKLESWVGSESFKLLDRISRAATPERAYELVNKSLAGKTQREELLAMADLVDTLWLAVPTFQEVELAAGRRCT